MGRTRAYRALLIGYFLFSATCWGDTGAPRQTPLFPVSLQESLPQPAATFEEIRQLILSRYYSTSISEEALYSAAIKGMLAHISPPDNPSLAALWSPDEYQRILDNLKGVQVSIGLKSKFDLADGSLTITEVMPGSPAVGRLRELDRILRIDGQSLKGKRVSQLNSLMQGDAGTSIVLTVVRDITVLDILLTRQQFELQNLQAIMLPDDIALISVKKISADISKQLQRVLSDVVARDIQRVIIDLRANTGGLFLEGLRLAELFLPNKSILLRTLKNPEKIENYVSSNAKPLQLEVVMLINKKTASASEIFATAMKAHGVAQLVGTSTYGKATLEETFELQNGFRTKFIVGAMYSPRGRSWFKSGVLPDFYVDQDIDLHAKLESLTAQQRLAKDLQLNAAWRLLKGES